MFYGNYSTWEEALNHSAQYRTDIEKYPRRVQSQDARITQWAIAVGLLMPPASEAVLDFGGGVGSVYYEMRSIFAPQWRIVELPPLVEYGNASLAKSGLSFHASIEDALKGGFAPDAIVSSSVLQYLPNPYETLQQLASIGVRKIILTRTLVADRERIMVQRVPKVWGGSRHPVRFLEESRLLAELKDYRLFHSHDWGHGDGHLYGTLKHMSYIFLKDVENDTKHA